MKEYFITQSRTVFLLLMWVDELITYFIYLIGINCHLLLIKLLYNMLYFRHSEH